MPTQYEKGSQKRHNGGIIRKTTSGKWVAEVNRDSKRRRASFDTVTEGRKWIDDETARRGIHGKDTFDLNRLQLRDSKDAIHKLNVNGYDLSLCAVVDDYMTRHPITEKVYTLQGVIDLHLDSMARRKCRPDSITGTRKILAMVATHIGRDRAYTDITPEEITGMVKGWDIANRTKKNRAREMRTLFLFAENEHGLRNPIAEGIKVDDVKRDEESAIVMKPGDVERFMRWVEENKPQRHIVSYALQFFAGIRPSGEAARLTWDNIRLNEKNALGGRGVIRLEGKHTKTRGIRSIPISPNLREWLLCYQGKGKISPAYSGLSLTRQEACKALNIDWTPDITRHSFATAAGEIHGQAEAAQWLGHEQSMRMFKKHYEGQFTNEEAQRFFNIEPIPAKAGRLLQMEASA